MDAIIEKWAEEHPIKTRQSELLKLFPNADLDKDGVFEACPRSVERLFEADCGITCAECRKSYWLAEIKEPEVDWSKVAVDTPIYVRNREDDYWEKRHFAKYENGMVYAWVNGTTSYTTIDAEDCALWIHAKLAEEKHEDN